MATSAPTGDDSEASSPRHLRTSRRRCPPKAVIVALLLGVAIGGTSSYASSAADVSNVSSAGTLQPLAALPGPNNFSTQSGISATDVRVEVPSATAVILDSGGAPIRAITNMTRPPTLGDPVYVYGEGHMLVSAEVAGDVYRVAAAQHWTEPGVWHAL
jgi:hypothetical protein